MCAVQAPRWHATPIPEVLAALDTSPQGLTSTEAAARLERYGPNQLQFAPSVAMLDEFSNPLILILLGAVAGRLPAARHAAGRILAA